MGPCGIQTAKMLSHDNRKTAAWLLFGLVALTVCVAMSTPFVYETRSLLTKIGLEESLYRAKQVISLVAAMLVCLQVVLAEAYLFSIGCWGNLQFNWQQWPALVGFVTLMVALVIVYTSIFRQRYDIRYNLWLRFHQPLGYLAFVGIIVHLLNVSEPRRPGTFFAFNMCTVKYFTSHEEPH